MLDLLSEQSMIDEQKQDGTQDSNEKAIEVQASYALRSKQAEHPTAQHGANNPQDNIQEKSLARLIDNLASDKPSDQAEYDPR